MVREMPVYSFIATGWEADPTARFLGFTNNASSQYFSMQREEGSEGIILPNAENVWIELDDQGWGGHGSIASLSMDRGGVSVRLTEDMARRLGGYETLRVVFTFPDSDFHSVRRQLLWVMAGYHAILEIGD